MSNTGCSYAVMRSGTRDNYYTASYCLCRPTAIYEGGWILVSFINKGISLCLLRQHSYKPQILVSIGLKHLYIRVQTGACVANCFAGFFPLDQQCPAFRKGLHTLHLYQPGSFPVPAPPLSCTPGEALLRPKEEDVRQVNFRSNRCGN